MPKQVATPKLPFWNPSIILGDLSFGIDPENGPTKFVETKTPIVPYKDFSRMIPSDSQFHLQYKTQSDKFLLDKEESYTILDDFYELEAEPVDLPSPNLEFSMKMIKKVKKALKKKAMPKVDPENAVIGPVNPSG